MKTKAERDAIRYGILHFLYKQSDGAAGRGYHSRTQLAEALELDIVDVHSAVDYLLDEGLGDFMGPSTIGITHRGIKEVEQAEAGESTDHFAHGAVVISHSPGAQVISVQGHSNLVTGTVTSGQASIESILKSLLESGVPEPDAREFVEAIQEEPSTELGKFGPRGSLAASKLFTLASSGVWRVGLDVAGKVLGEVAKAYFHLNHGVCPRNE